MVVWVPDWPVHCLVVDLPPGGAGAVVHADRIEVASFAARSAGVRSGMSIREATYLCPDLLCLPRDPDREARAFSAVIDAFDSVAAGVECVRPGLARCRVRGPARWHGSEEAAASALVSAIEEAVGVECFVGIADGPVASLEAAREGRIVPFEDNQSFLGRIPLRDAIWAVPAVMTDRAADTLDLLQGLGVNTCADFLALGRGRVCERFGDVGEALWNLASGGDSGIAPAARIQPDITVERVIEVGGESIDTMMVPIQRIARDLTLRLGQGGLVSQTLRIDVEDAGGGQRTRTWCGCDLSAPDDVALRVRWTLAGWTSGVEGPSGAVTCIRLTACDPRAGQSMTALWGRSDRERDVSRSVVRIQGMAGPDALLVPRVQGGYDPRSRVVMARWGSEPRLRSREGAWEGGVAQSPATLFDAPARVRVVGASGTFDDVRVDQRGALSAAPAYLVSEYDSARSAPRKGRRVAIARVEGPWPVGGRWWAQERPRAYMRAVLEDGRDVLLVWKGGEWALEGLTQ